jgi:hypothetical protein
VGKLRTGRDPGNSRAKKEADPTSNGKVDYKLPKQMTETIFSGNLISP